jgi:hypothetical protein
LYDFLINNLQNCNGGNGIDFNVLTKSTLTITMNFEIYKKYIFIIVNYIKYITENENSENLDNPNDKYYCSRETLINMYNILLFPKYFVELQNTLKKEFDELMTKEESKQPSNKMLREYIKTIYCKIRIRQNQTNNVYNLMLNASNKYGIERHKNIDILIEYLIKIPDYLIDNEIFKNVLIKKTNEFMNSNADESYIETAHMMQTVRKYHEILQSMFGS